MSKQVKNSHHGSRLVPKARPSSYNLHNPYLSANFKIWIVGCIFLLVFIRLSSLIFFPDANIISDKIILGIVLALIGYLWGQEVRDRHRLELMNADLIRAQKKLENAEIDTISSLILMEEAKDPYVHGHSSRVMKISLAMGDMLGFHTETKESIRRASILHDLGKIIVKEEILHKPAKLTDEEWTMVRKHPQMAVDILEPLRFLHLEKRIILHHHERIDGKGYPSGLEGDDIPLESRIIAIADTFDAMNSARIYRDPCPKDYILEELNRVAGTQLDAELVKKFLDLLEKNPDFWKRE